MSDLSMDFKKIVSQPIIQQDNLFEDFFFDCGSSECEDSEFDECDECGADIDSADNNDNNDNDDNNTKNVAKFAKFTKSKTIYENKELYSIEGELIGFIPERRYHWYIKKGLCKVIDEKSIMLNFHPNYKNEKVVIDREKQAPKENICVVCGCTENLKRFRVVPYEIKKLLPEENKTHMSSDVVVVCDPKSADGDYYNKELKLKMFEEHQIDINNFKINSKKRNIYTIVQKLAKQDFTCTNKYTMKTLEDYFGYSPAKQDYIDLMSEVDNFTYMGFKTPEEMLVSKIVEGGADSVKEFIKRWKKNFSDTMNPQYLQWDFWNCEQCF